MLTTCTDSTRLIPRVLHKPFMKKKHLWDPLKSCVIHHAIIQKNNWGLKQTSLIQGK